MGIENKDLFCAWIGLEPKGKDWGWIGTGELLSEELKIQGKGWLPGQPGPNLDCVHSYGPNHYKGDEGLGLFGTSSVCICLNYFF